MSNGMPYGNAFLVTTPHLDQLGNRIYMEEQQRNLARQKEMAALDDMVTKEVGKMRSADTGDFIQQYQKFKALKQQLSNPRTAPKNALEQNRLNQEANLQLSKAMQLAQQSSEIKDQLKQLALDRGKDPNKYQDDFLDRYKAATETPISQMENHPKYGNLLDQNIYSYPGGNTDFSKQLKYAEGGIRETNPFAPEIDPNDKFKMIDRKYKVKNDPYSYYNNLLSGVYGSQRQRDFPLQFKYTPEQEQDIQDRFKQLVSDPKYKKIYGLSDNVDFPASAYNTELGRTARLKSMEYALDAANQPTMKENRIPNTEAITADRQKFAQEQQARAAANSLSRLYIYASIKDKEPENVERNIDGVIAHHIQDARNNGGEISVDNDTFKSITGEEKKRNSVLTINEDKTYSYGIKDPTTGKVDHWTTVPYELAKTKLTKTYKSGLDSKFNTGNKNITVPNTPKQKSGTVAIPSGATIGKHK